MHVLPQQVVPGGQTCSPHEALTDDGPRPSAAVNIMTPKIRNDTEAKILARSLNLRIIAFSC